jgi:CcmD family protein
VDRRVLGTSGTRRATAVLAALLVIWACGSPPAVQGQPQGPAQEKFEPVRPGELGQEQLPATGLVFAAYAFVWLVLIFYVFSLWRRLTRVERDLADVSSRLRTRRQ